MNINPYEPPQSVSTAKDNDRPTQKSEIERLVIPLIYFLQFLSWVAVVGGFVAVITAVWNGKEARKGAIISVCIAFVIGALQTYLASKYQRRKTVYIQSLLLLLLTSYFFLWLI